MDAPSTLAPSECDAFFCNTLNAIKLRRQEAHLRTNPWHDVKTFGVLFHTEHSCVVSQVHQTGSANQSPTTPCILNVIQVPGHARHCPMMITR